jgi:hypothetical protein
MLLLTFDNQVEKLALLVANQKIRTSKRFRNKRDS